jgi:hypothetical protein
MYERHERGQAGSRLTLSGSGRIWRAVRNPGLHPGLFGLDSFGVNNWNPVCAGRTKKGAHAVCPYRHNRDGCAISGAGNVGGTLRILGLRFWENMV